MENENDTTILDQSECEQAISKQITLHSETSQENRSPSPAEDITSSVHGGHENFVSSTPVAGGRGHVRPTSLADLSPCVPSRTLPDSVADRNSDFHTSLSTSQIEMGTQDTLKAPIVGYEVMDERSKFTVFRIQVCQGPHDRWFLFRRYSDFVRLNTKLKELFPNFRLSLPPKKWFGNNFDPNFLEDRMLGLQAFVNNIIGHRDLCLSEPVREYFCLDDPPGPHDSLEESRALCESLEEDNYKLKQELLEREEQISQLEEEVLLQKAEVENLKKSLRMERSMSRHCSPSSQPSECSLPEHEQLTSEIISQTELKTSEHIKNRVKPLEEVLSRNGIAPPNASYDTRPKGLTKIGDTPENTNLVSSALQPTESHFMPVDLSS